jgi:capsid protein
MQQPKFTQKVSAGTRLYYFDINTDKNGVDYLSITEVPTERKPGQKFRQKIFVHSEDIPAFLEAMSVAAAKILEYGGN